MKIIPRHITVRIIDIISVIKLQGPLSHVKKKRNIWKGYLTGVGFSGVGSLFSELILMPFFLFMPSRVMCNTAGDNNNPELLDSLRIDKVEVSAYGNSAGDPLCSVIIDTSIIKSSKSFTLGEMLQRSSSVNIKNYGRGATQQATFRGTSATHTTVYWNGIEINSPITGAVDFSLIPMYMVDQVSVEAGVSADNHGIGSLGGTITLQSKPDWNEKPFGVTLAGGYGSFHSADGYLEIKAGGEKVRSNTRIYANRSRNDFEFVNRDVFDPEKPGWHPVQKNLNADYSNFGFMQEIWAKPAENQTLSAIVWGTGNIRNLPQLTSWEGEQNSNLTSSRDRALRATVDYKYYSERIDFSISAGGSLEDNLFEKNNKTATGYNKYIDTRGFSKSGQIEGDITWKIDDRFKLSSITKGLYCSASSRDLLYGEGYDKGRGEFSEILSLSADWTPIVNTTIMGRCGMVGDTWYLLPTLGVNLKAGEASTFSIRGDMDVHFPTLSDLYYIPGGNKDLQMEKSATAEIGYTYRKNDLRVIATAYYSHINDWILWLPTAQQYWTASNVRSVNAFGLEITAGKVWKLGDWKIDVDGNLTINSTRAEDSYSKRPVSTDQLPYVPPVSYSIFLDVSWKKLSLIYQGYGESAKYASMAASSSKNEIIYGYYLQDITLGYNFPFVTVEGVCRNILDCQYYGILRRPMAPRSFEIRARFHF